MNKKQIIITVMSVVSIAAVVVIVVACSMIPAGETPENVHTIESNDGTAWLEIPENALPEDVDINNILVTNVPAKEGFIVYNLKPDGLTFNEAIVFKTTFDNPEHAIPIVYQTTESDCIEIINDIKVDIDVKANKSTVSVPLLHFSSLRFYQYWFSGEAQASDTPVGSNVNSSCVITKKDDDIVVDNGHTLFHIEANAVMIKGSLDGSPRLIPQEDISDRPPKTLFYGDTFTISGNEFICEEPGYSHITYRVEINYTYQLWSRDHLTGDWTRRPEYDTIMQVNAPYFIDFECIAATTPSVTTPPPESTAIPQSPNEAVEDPVIISEEELDFFRMLMVIPQNNFNDDELFIPKELFEEKGAEVTVASTSKNTAEGMFGNTIIPDLIISDVNVDFYDAFVIVGGYGSIEYLWENDILFDLVQSAYEKGKVVSAICLSPVVLARAGILEGIQATVYQDPEAIGELNICDAVYVDEDVVVSDRIVTGRGPESSREFALKVWDMLALPNSTE
ncbi:DJ-1/PfpI family protein [Chloroflexota bacterium]